MFCARRGKIVPECELAYNMLLSGVGFVTICVLVYSIGLLIGDRRFAEIVARRVFRHNTSYIQSLPRWRFRWTGMMLLLFAIYFVRVLFMRLQRMPSN